MASVLLSYNTIIWCNDLRFKRIIFYSNHVIMNNFFNRACFFLYCHGVTLFDLEFKIHCQNQLDYNGFDNTKIHYLK